MSLLDKIEGAEHSTVAFLEKELTKIEGAEPKIAELVDVSLTYIAPVLQIALTAVGDPAAAATVGAVSTQAQKDLAVASALVTDFGPTPTASALLSSVATNLSGVLTAAHVTNATSVGDVNKAVSEVTVLSAAVQAAATAITSAATTS